VKTGVRLGLATVIAALVPGCSVPVASLGIAMPRPVSADLAASPLISRGWREGTSCRFWLVGVPFGLPQVDEAIGNAMAPVQGILMREVTVDSVHPVYGLFGWHCYRVRGEVLAPQGSIQAVRADGAPIVSRCPDGYRPTSVQVMVNDEPRVVDAGATVADLVAALGLGPRRIAVEVNRAVVPRADYGATALRDGDAVEIIHFVGGG